MDELKTAVFICHASEDKEHFVRPLAQALKASGIDVWYDEYSLKLGESLRESIDRGLARSRYAIVVLSPDFFAKRWTNWELDGLVQLHLSSKDGIILPIWLNVNAQTVMDSSPSLANIIAVSAELGLAQVVEKLVNHIVGDKRAGAVPLLPSTAMAIGFFRSYLAPIVTAIMEGRPDVWIEIDEFEIPMSDVDIFLLIPNSEQEAMREHHFQLMESLGLRQGLLKSRFGRANFATVGSVTIVGPRLNRYLLYDIPISLRVVFESVRYAAGSAASVEAIEALELREAANFRRSLARLLDERFGVGWMDRVKILSAGLSIASLKTEAEAFGTRSMIK
jgi:hypothetical protein